MFSRSKYGYIFEKVDIWLALLEGYKNKKLPALPQGSGREIMCS